MRTEREPYTIIYPFLPHYRQAVFGALVAELGDENLLIIHGDSAPSHNRMELMQSPYPFRHGRRVANRWWGPFLWQIGLLAELRKSGRGPVMMFADIHYASTWVAAAYCRLVGRRVIFWTIGWHRPPTSLLERYSRLAFYRLSSQMAVYSEHGKQLGISAGFPMHRIKVIGNSVQPNSVGGEEERISDLHSEFVVGAVIRLTSNKGLDSLLYAVADLRVNGMDVGVILVGEGPEADELRRISDSLSVPLYLPGPRYSLDALAEVYEKMDLTVVPKNIGLTAIQSLSFGVPVVTDADLNKQMPEAEAVIDGRTGYTYRGGSTGALGAAITRGLLATEEQRRQVADQCVQEVLSSWSPDVTARKIANMLNKP